MYVLIDLEWITDQHGRHWPTQLAASRVDRAWNTADTFSVLFRPKDASFQGWDHMAFSGWSRQDFVRGRDLYAGLDGFQRWLRPGDVLCWWHPEAGDMYNRFVRAAQLPRRPAKTLFLRNYVYGFLAGQENAVGSPYQLCAARGIPTPGPAHCSPNDVAAMQALVKGIGFPQRDLLYPPGPRANGPVARRGTAAFPLLCDPEARLLHRSDCEILPDDRLFPAFSSFQAPIRHRYRPCSCCRAEYYKALRDRNWDSIARSEYNYVYSKSSGVFHTRGCSHILLAYDILGAVSYDVCVKTGRRPCKHCTPLPPEEAAAAPAAGPEKPMRKPQRMEGRTLSKDERSALGRFRRAKEERETALKKGELTEAERNTVMALSQPGLAFWAGKGYSTFHRRNCPKLTGLSQLKGFSRYQDAVRAGYSPCRHCRPSPKQDAAFSIPITSRERAGESADTLAGLYAEHDLAFRSDERYFTIETPVGRWRIDMSLRPVRLEHINFVTSPGCKKYHVQPRLFLSLRDTFDYIIRHDSALMAERGSGTFSPTLTTS